MSSVFQPNEIPSHWLKMIITYAHRKSRVNTFCTARIRLVLLDFLTGHAYVVNFRLTGSEIQHRQDMCWTALGRCFRVDCRFRTGTFNNGATALNTVNRRHVFHHQDDLSASPTTTTTAVSKSAVPSQQTALSWACCDATTDSAMTLLVTATILLTSIITVSLCWW